MLGLGLLAWPFLSKETLSTQSVETKVTRNDGVVTLLALVFRIKGKFVMVGSETEKRVVFVEPGQWFLHPSTFEDVQSNLSDSLVYW